MNKKQQKQEKENALNKWFPQKIRLSKEFIDQTQKQKNRQLSMGAIHLCQLGENIGSEQGEERPILIVSNNRMNSTSTNIVVIPLSKNLKKRQIQNKDGKLKEVPKLKTHYFLLKNKYPFLDYDSAVMAEGIRTVSKIRIGKHMGKVDEKDFSNIKNRLRWIFNI